ncbi:hypothetical protein EVAR_33135_1 [Eumeta japonica]|uniref:Uncharacterized protein n=1 Tax=Eumeta variegata TaxID=151549 RepID=A0A4C1YA18_EUMVA|nr:hypothetical protein EVAR_33135_1 [Eumeta japonica]
MKLIRPPLLPSIQLFNGLKIISPVAFNHRCNIRIAPRVEIRIGTKTARRSGYESAIENQKKFPPAEIAKGGTKSKNVCNNVEILIYNAGLKLRCVSLHVFEM